ncbi:MAG: excinuclease ABC subunit UvrC [Chloroflexi bacterium]|nr:excinuclease ABC subunit UvrC [Chloroflexota bacterium]
MVTVADALGGRLRATPTSPGVYIMKDGAGKVLYVGKAASLRHRLRSYFAPSASLEPRVRSMVSHVADFEYLVTETEGEALILENTLIKRHRPPYNARLKDDKTYPYIKIDLKEAFPQVYFTRRFQEDGARYFGPFASASSVRMTMDLLKKLFPYRSCTKPITGSDPRPCLEYYIHRCVGPCIGAVSREEYRQVVQQVIQFLEGKTEQVLRDLRREMQGASERLDYERAALLRDQVRAIERVSESQKVASARQDDQDVVALAASGAEAWVEVFFIRRGKLIGRDHFLMEGTQDQDPEQVLRHFIQQFYDAAPHVPRGILLQYPVEDTELIQGWLSQKGGHKVRLCVPRRGARRRLVEMVAENAAQGLQQRVIKWQSDATNLQRAMEELMEALSLPRLPRRVECYDISNIQGTNPVGSLVVFEDGRPKNGSYRRFQIRQIEGVDDYAMMQEMLRRRFRRLAEQLRGSDGRRDGADAASTDEAGAHDSAPKEQSWGIVPDLVVIDGGKGHLSAALQVFLELGLVETIPLASLAKQREELFVPQNPDPVLLPRGSQGLFLVQRIRDEAHRFAITYHRQRRSKGAVQSALDSVPGIGPKRRRMLLRRFGSVVGIRGASLQEVAAVPGMTMRLAQRLKERL